MRRGLLSSLATALLVSACAGAPTPDAMEKPTEGRMDRPAETAMPKPIDAEIAQPTNSAPGDAMMNKGPAWLDTELRDVNSGQSFKLSGFQGQIVLVETMAVWCTNCKRQQQELVQLHAQIGDAATSVAIDIDLNEDEALLKRHAESNGFDWRYAIASPELVQALADQFGNQVLNPTSVPMFLIDKDGGVHLLDFGHKSVAYLTQQVQSYQD